MLRESTGDRVADKIIKGVIGIFGQVCPDRVRGYYLRGSYATGTRTAGSDLDMFVVFAGRLERDEAVRARNLAGSCALLSPILLEIIVVSEEQLHKESNLPLALNLKLASRLVYGEDIRDGLPELRIDTYVRSLLDTPYHTYVYPTGRREDPVLTYPLRHIDPDGPLFGFDQWQLSDPDGGEVQSTKLLVATVCWTATALVALRTGRYVADKSAGVALYRELISDEWTALVTDVYEWCRNRWHYRLPPGEADRRRLREMCDRTLAFQNHFLGHYRAYQLVELRCGVPERQALAARGLGQIRFPDPEVAEALRLAGQ